MAYCFKNILVVAAMIFLLAACTEKAPVVVTDPAPLIKEALVLTKTDGFRHSSIEAGVAMFRQNAQKWKLNIAIATDTRDFTPVELAKYHVVVLLNTTGNIFNDEEQLALQTFIRNGGRLLGIHAATDAEYDWPWYGQMMGAWFDNHPAIQQANCEIKLPGHTAAAGLPATWQRTDEWYNFKQLQPGLKVIVSVDEQTYTGGTHGDNHPVSWCQKFEGGKVFYTAMGHTDSTYSEPLFIQHIGNAISWLMAD